MTNFDRRHLISSSAAFGGLLLLSCKTTAAYSRLKDGLTAPLAPRVRKRWEPGKHSDFKAQYIQAVEWLKANDKQKFPDADPRSYLTWSRFVDIHNSSCPHGNWLFVPWHRLYLYYFETACQIALDDPDFALPYWDWTLDPVIPEEFFTSPSLKVSRRVAKLGDSIPPEFTGQSVMDRIYANGEFYSFFSRPTDYFAPFSVPAGAGGSAVGTFEAIPHNNVHKFIGGLMANNESPTDPIFWLHHGNVDRIWRQFQRIHPAVLPEKVAKFLRGGSNVAARDDVAEVYMATALDYHRSGDELQPGIDWPEQKRKVEFNLTVKDVQDLKNFGYVYDTDSLPPPAIPNSQRKGIAEGQAKLPDVSRLVIKGRSRFSYGFVGTNVVSSERIVTTIDVADKESKIVLAAFRSSIQASVAFTVAYLLPPTDQEMKDSLVIRFFAFIDDTYKTFDYFNADAYTKAEYVGVYSFFGADHVHKGESGQTAKNAVIDFTNIFRSYLGESEVKTITLVAVAMNMRTRKPMSYFTASPKTELGLQFDAVKSILP